jgi:hypothetical protein
MSTTEARAQHSAIIQALADLVNLPQTDKQCEDELLPRDPVMRKVVKIREAADALLRAALAAAAPSPEPALWVSPGQLAEHDPQRTGKPNYLPAMKHQEGIFTQPLYAAPGPAASTADLSALAKANSAVVNEYLDDYEMDDGENSSPYVPSEHEAFLICDAVQGLLAHDEFVSTFNAWQDAVRARLAAPMLNGLTASETAETASVAGLTPKCSNCGSSTAMQCNGMGCFALEGQGEVPDEPSAADWGVDYSTGTPILTYKNCSVIEGEQARHVLRLLDATPPARDAGLSLTDEEIDDAVIDALNSANASTNTWDRYTFDRASDRSTTCRYETQLICRAALAAAQEKRA